MEKGSTFISWISYCSKSPDNDIRRISTNVKKRNIFSSVLVRAFKHKFYQQRQCSHTIIFEEPTVYSKMTHLNTFPANFFRVGKLFFWKTLPETFPRFLYDFPWLLASILYDFPWLLASILYDSPWLSWENIYICPWLKF